MVDDGTHAVGGVVASECLLANLGDGVVTAGGTVVRISANENAQSDYDDNNETNILEVILGRQMGQCEDTAYD